MFVLDSLLVNGLRFVLDKIATAADSELNDESRWRERLLEAQMKLELGEMSDEEFASVEKEVLSHLREIREARGEASAGEPMAVEGVEVNSTGDWRDEQ